MIFAASGKQQLTAFQLFVPQSENNFHNLLQSLYLQ